MKLALRWLTVKLPYPAVEGCLWRHRWSGWIENLGRYATGARYRMCERCGKLEVGA